jgi:hypothetical protein
MLLLFAIIVVLLVAVLSAFVIRRVRPELPEQKHRKQLNGEGLRPLFMPTDEELRAEEREKEEIRRAESRDEALKSQAKKLAKLEEFRQTWHDSPDKLGTIELLRAAAMTEDGNAYSETAEQVIETWAENKISGLDREDLAQLLESHFWLLPADKRTPGVSFRLKKEIADLRREPEQKHRSA